MGHNAKIGQVAFDANGARIGVVSAMTKLTMTVDTGEAIAASHLANKATRTLTFVKSSFKGTFA